MSPVTLRKRVSKKQPALRDVLVAIVYKKSGKERTGQLPSFVYYTRYQRGKKGSGNVRRAEPLVKGGVKNFLRKGRVQAYLAEGGVERDLLACRGERPTEFYGVG